MDWLTFLASIVGSLAWPASVVITVLILRRALNKLLPELNRLKYKDLELEFGKEVAQAKIEIEASPEIKQLPGTGQPEAAPDAAYLSALAEISPRAAVLEAWLPFEVALGRVAQKLDLTDRGHALQMPRMIDALVTRRVLTTEEGRAISRLREVRNKVVHARDVDLATDSVAEFARVLSEVTVAMERRAATLFKGAAQQPNAADEGADG
jgi:hypothetical protein